MSSTNQRLMRGAPNYGQGQIVRTRLNLQAIDNPTETQLASNIYKCPGIGAIPNKTVLLANGTLYYRPKNSQKIIPVATNGDKV